MLSFNLIVFICVVSSVCGQKPSDTTTDTPSSPVTVTGNQKLKEEICKKPSIESGLAVYPNGLLSNETIYLFRRPYIMPFVTDRHEIDWKNIKHQKEVLTNFPRQDTLEKTPVKFAFWSDNKVYLNYGGDGNAITVYESSVDGKTFKYKENIPWTNIGFEYLQWNVTTFHNQKPSNKTMYFMDSTPVKSGSKLVPKTSELMYNSSKTESTLFTIRHSSALDITRINIIRDLFPMALMYTNPIREKISLPIEFDGYYQTKKQKVVFFKDQSVCIKIFERNLLTDYCQSFFEVQHIIGCTQNTDKTVGPEVFDGNEDDVLSDIHSEF